MELVRVLSEEYQDYLRDESRSTGYADSISFPKTEEEVVELVKHFTQLGESITIQGARTGLAAAAVPKGGHILNLSRMTKITGLRYEEEQKKYFLRVQPGVLLSQVRKALENKAFEIANWSAASIEALKDFKAGAWFFSPDPTEPTASIGGMASCNAAGARAFYYGATRYHINGVRVVLSDGSITDLRRGKEKAEGRKFILPLVGGGEWHGELPSFNTPSVKDAAGFYFREDMDLVDLFVGAQGTLGVITELELELLPAPKMMWGLTVFLPSTKAALNYVRLLRGEKLDGMPLFQHKPASIEFFDHNSIDMLLKQKEVTPAFAGIQEIKTGFTTAVYAEFHSQDPESIWPALEDLSIVVKSVGGNPDNTWVANCSREMEKLIFFRHAVSESVNIVIDQNRKKEASLTMLGTDMAVPDSELDSVMDIYLHDLKKTTLHWIIFGHIGENHLHVNILPRSKDEYHEGYELFKVWGGIIAKMGGTVSAEHGVGKLKAPFIEIMYGKEKIEEMRSFKKSLDPHGIFCPGNIIG